MDRRQQLDADFIEFATAAWRQLIQAANLLTRDPHEADDLVQHTLASTYARWSRIHATDDVYAYVRRSLVNAYLDGWRRRQRLKFRLTADQRDLDRAVADETGSVADRSQVEVLLARLTSRERAVIVMRYYLDLTQPDVAAALGVTVGTVASTTSRALAKMRVHTDAPTQGLNR